jgi:uncharacterized phage-associated protein
MGSSGFMRGGSHTLCESEGNYTMVSCYDVAQYFLAKADEDAGDLISNLKLQKLLYYAQGCALVLWGRPLFPEPMEAWVHGPVVPALYHEYKGYGAGPIPPPTTLDFSKYDPDTRDLLDEVYMVYGQFSAWKLRNMTHQEAPWRQTPEGKDISHAALRDYFATQVQV